MKGNYFFVTIVLWLSISDFCQSIMVTFGTSKEPILPRIFESRINAFQPRNLVARSPAPVREVQDDIPNPNQYQPPVPHQYRTKLYSFKPSPNLFLGTPIDQKYTPSLQKYDLHRKQYSRNLGLDYTGPHTFEKQDYEIYEIKKTTLQPSVKYREEELRHRFKADQQNKLVPQIGIIYSGGVRYYVPQIVYFSTNIQGGEDENSVYDKNDEKNFVYNGQQ